MALGVVVLAGAIWIGSRFVRRPSIDPPLPPEPSITSQLSPASVDSASERESSAGSQSRRYANTWVNVRERRSVRSPVAWVLDPGEAVLVDSLVTGWYRIEVDGQVLGYAARPFFDSSPPAAGR